MSERGVVEDKTVTAVEMAKEAGMPDRAEPPPVVFRNNHVVGVLVFMLLWLGLLGCFTYFYARQQRYSVLGPSYLISDLILGVLWLFGVGGAAWAFIQPRIAVSVAGGGVLAREIWLWRVRERRYAAADVFVPHVEAGTDNDGDPYFKCLLLLPNGRVLTVAEGYERTEVEATRRRLLAELAA
jgi:hypothetical protein